jgi:hypothetical protein
MVVKKLIQKGWSAQNEITIGEDHLKVISKTIKEDLEYTISFQDLGFETVRKIDRSTNFGFYFFLIATLVFLYAIVKAIYTHESLSSILIGFFVVILTGFLSLSAYKRSNKKIIYLSGGTKVLELLDTKPDPQTLSVFIDEVHNAIRAYYKRVNTDFDDNTPYEERLFVLKWLKEMKSITDEEFNELKATYKTDNIIGFKRDDNDQY